MSFIVHIYVTHPIFFSFFVDGLQEVKGGSQSTTGGRARMGLHLLCLWGCLALLLGQCSPSEHSSRAECGSATSESCIMHFVHVFACLHGYCMHISMLVGCCSWVPLCICCPLFSELAMPAPYGLVSSCIFGSTWVSRFVRMNSLSWHAAISACTR